MFRIWDEIILMIFLPHGMDSAFKLIGGVFIILSFLWVCGGTMYVFFKTREKPSVDELIHTLGVVGLIIWILVGAGVASWLISVIYVSLINLIYNGQNSN